MTTLPDGTTVTPQYGPERFEIDTLGTVTRQHGPEGFEIAPPPSGTVSISASATTVSPGQTVTIFGAFEDANGTPQTGADFTVEAKRAGSTIVTKSGKTDASGEYSATITPAETGTMTVQTTTDGVAPQFGPAGFEITEIGPTTSQFGPAGFEITEPTLTTQFGPEGYES